MEHFLPDRVGRVVAYFGFTLAIWCRLDVQLYIWIRRVNWKRKRQNSLAKVAQDDV